MNRLQKIDELRTMLENLIGRKYADEIYNEIKAEANVYGIDQEITRLERFVELAAAGCNPTHLVVAAREREENLYLYMMGMKI